MTWNILLRCKVWGLCPNFVTPWCQLCIIKLRHTVNWAARCSSINVINVIILLSNIYTFNKCLHIHKAYTKLMQETLNLKKGLILLKPLKFFFANDNKIIKLKCCENFKTWKCLEVVQMASTSIFLWLGPLCGSTHPRLLLDFWRKLINQNTKLNVIWSLIDKFACNRCIYSLHRLKSIKVELVKWIDII